MRLIAKSIARKTIVPFLFKMGYYRRILDKYGKGKAIVLMYHNITPSWKDRFKQQMRFLRDYMHPIPLNELVDCLVKEKPFPPKSIAVTFDDGYESVYYIAFPILQKYSIPATVFLVTGYVGTDRVFWWDEIRRMWESVPYKEFRKTLDSVLKEQMSQIAFSDSKNFEVEKYLTNRCRKIYSYHIKAHHQWRPI